MRAPPELEAFIRDTLGCGCPDAVFEAVDTRRGALLAGDRDDAWWIEVGGRLLIAVADAGTGTALADRLAEVVEAGRVRRDASGFNRFRLVVRAAPGLEATALERRFAALAAGDERLHVHVVAPGDLPPLNATEHVT